LLSNYVAFILFIKDRNKTIVIMSGYVPTVNITETIRQRYSVRLFKKLRLAEPVQDELKVALAALCTAPFRSVTRFLLASASESERSALKGLGTYGFIKNPAAFIIGGVENGPHAMEDYGYAMECAILAATRLGLGTCWLGGSFTQSSFARKLGKREGEVIPAVTALGYASEDTRQQDAIRRQARADQRLPWAALFFEGGFEKILLPQNSGAFGEALENVRLGPSASNKQPWRLVKEDHHWHFYLCRTPGYGQGSLVYNILRLADLQRLDVGIAMCHFELTARELGFSGRWLAQDPGLAVKDEYTSYIATWETR
jgi:nitroreductase